ncbi:MAG: hypothetical protein COR54_04650 [Elusimicrobia bacterium CG22_combo_CG10-13_8_21_14_all_63_91]|nr:MAG: hypothetical protein COR54_04650 [Elusimicrobia bacterium CG22_combo_CG10-13_8_21_14_all_63_91]
MHFHSRFADRAARCLSGLLALAVWISSFGVPAARAAASALAKTAAPSAAPVSLSLPALSGRGSSALPGAALAPALPGGTLPSLAVLATPRVLAAEAAAPTRAAASPAAVSRKFPSPASRAAATAAAVPAVKPQETVRAGVAAAVARLEKAGSAPDAKGAILDGLYFGAAREGVNAADAVDGSGAPKRRADASLKKLAIGELVAAAARSERALDSRLAAVRVLEKVPGAEGRAALEEVAAANPEGGASDYEVHRAALRALDLVHGVLRSLRPISEAHRKAILTDLAAEKPEIVLSDYDRTLAGTKEEISPRMAAALAAVFAADVEIALLTDRPAQPRFKGDITIFQSLAPMSPAQKEKLTVLSDIGAKTSLFDRNGSAVLIEESRSEWTPAERRVLADASRALKARFAEQDFLGNTEVYESDSYERFLPRSLGDEEIAEAGRIVDGVLKEGGLSGTHIVARRPLGAGDVPYVRVSAIDKSAAASRVRRDIRSLERARDTLRWGGGARALRWVGKIFSRFPARPIAARNTLVLGDSFMPEAVAPGADALMAQGAPGARVIAVAAAASPRLDNVFVWPTAGEAASLEILGAVASMPAGEADKKAVAGLFAQRTIAITTYILTTIAFTAISVPVIGWVGYGAVMAVGSLAPIAVGPLNGWLVDKLSARNSMAINTAARVVLDLFPPVLVLLGLINTPMLIIASVANFWILSSVMTTEGAYIKRLAGKKYVGPVNSLLWMNYLVVQVVLALILGFGAVVGMVGPINAYFIAAAINALVILPLVWFTMPNHKPMEPARTDSPRPSASERAAKTRAALLELVKRYRVGLVLLAASILSFVFVWHSPVPVALALAYLVTRTDGAKQLWAGRGRDVGKREQELVERIRAMEADGKNGSDELKAAKSELERWKKSPRIAMLYIALGAMTLGPLQSFAIPRFTEAVTGLPMSSPESTLLFGQYLGALFFGSLIANAAQVRLPELKVPFFGRIAGQRFLQGLVALLAPVWVYTSLAPGSVLASLGAFAAAALLMTLAAKLTNRAWIRILGLGMAGLWLPFFAWGSSWLSPATAMFLTVILAGAVYGPSFVALKTIFEGGLQKNVLGKMIGVQGSLLNAARSVAIGGTAAIYGALNPAFPIFLAVLGGFYAAIGVAFWLAPRFFPGLPKTMLRPGEHQE